MSMAFTSAQRAPEETCRSEREQSFVSRHDERLDSSYEKEPNNRTVSNNRSFWGFWLRNINRIFLL